MTIYKLPNLTQQTCVLRASDKDNREKEPQPEEAQLVQATSYAAHVSNKLKEKAGGKSKSLVSDYYLCIGQGVVLQS